MKKKTQSLLVAAVIVGSCIGTAQAEGADDSKSEPYVVGSGQAGLLDNSRFKPYIGASLGVFLGQYKESTSAYSFDIKNRSFGGFVKGGVSFHPNFSTELRLGSASEMTTSWGAGTLGSTVPYTTKLRTDLFVSYLAVAHYELPVLKEGHGKFEVYGLLGGTTGKFKVTDTWNGTTTLITTTKTGASYGLGTSFSMDDRMSVGIEWASYLTNVKLGGTPGSLSLSGVSGSVGMKF